MAQTFYQEPTPGFELESWMFMSVENAASTSYSFQMKISQAW
jgi:hypothetical protein